MANNPWHVDSVKDFLSFKCPECIFDVKEEDLFLDHALDNHPKSFVIFSKASKEDEIDENSEIDNDIDLANKDVQQTFSTIDKNNLGLK